MTCAFMNKNAFYLTPNPSPTNPPATQERGIFNATECSYAK